MQHRYPKQVFWSDDDDGFIAVAPDLPGSSAFGESEAEALAELDQAIEAWIEAARAAGNPIPDPSEPARQHSGKLLVRMPRSLHRDLANQAEREGVSLNLLIVSVLSQRSSVHASALASTSASGVNAGGLLFGPATWTGQALTLGTIEGTISNVYSKWISRRLAAGWNFASYEPPTDRRHHLSMIFNMREASTGGVVAISSVSPFEERKQQLASG
jgi:predicted RNase H-like HicB family nuclease